MIKKQFYQVALLIFMLLIMLGLYLPIRSHMVEQLERIKSTLISSWEREYGMEIKYRSASPTIINSLRIRDFSLSSGERADFSFNSERISLFYGLRPFSRDGHKISLNRLLIKRGMVYINLPSDNTPAETPDPDEISSRIQHIISAYFPSAVVELRDITVRIVRGGEIYHWNIGLLRCSAEDDSINISHKGSFTGGDDVSFALTARGSVGTSLDRLNFSTRLENFHSSFLGFDRLDFQVGMNGDELRISKVSDKFPVDISLQKKGTLWSLKYQSEDFTPSEIFSPGGEWQDYTPWFGLTLDGSLQCDYDSTTKTPLYSTDLVIKGNNDFIGEYLGGYTTVGLVLSGEQWNINSRMMDVRAPIGHFSYSGDMHLTDRQARGTFLIDRGRITPDLFLSAKWDILLDDSQFSLKTDSLRLGEKESGALTFSGEAQWEKRDILANAVYEGPLADYISLDIYADFMDSLSLKTWYDIQSLNLPELLDTAGLVPPESPLLSLSRGAVVNSRGSLDVSDSVLTAMVDRIDLLSPDFRFSAEGYGNGKKIVVSDLLFEKGNNRVVGSLTGLMGDINTLQSRLTYNGSPFDLDLIWQKEERTVAVEGSYDLKGNLRYFDNGMVHFNLASSPIPFNLQDNALKMKLGMSGMLSPDRWSVNFLENRIIIGDSPYLYPAEITFSGLLDNSTLHVNKLEWKDDFSKIQGNGKLLLPLAGSRQFNGWLTLDSDREEKYKFLFFKDGSHYNGYGDIENLIVKRIKALDREGTISASLNFQDLPLNSKIKGNISASLEEMGSLSCSLDLNDERVLLTDLAGDFGSARFNSGLITFNRNEGDLTMSLGLGGVLAKKEWKSGLYLKGRSEDILNPEKANFSGVLKTEEISFNGSVVSPPLSFHMDREGDDISLYNDDREVFNSYYSLSSGQIIVNSEKLLPLSFDLRGIMRSDAMDVTLSRIYMDMQKANSFMPVDYASKKPMVEFDQGILRGQITLKGTPASPDINGVLTIDPLQLNTAYSTKDKGVTRAAVDITENYITIPYFEMNVGKTGAVGLRGGILLDGWSPEEFHFDFSMIGKNGGSVPMIYPIKGLALNGEASGNVSFYGTGQQYFITGELLLDRMVMSLAQSPQKPHIPRNERPDPWDLNVDVSFITGKDVSMVVPNEDFHVVKAQLDIDQKLRFQLDNIPWLFSLTGDLAVRTGDIAYFDKNFNLTEGHVTFEENQENFDPFLDITAESDLTYQGNDVTLIIDYEGSLFGDFDPRFSSIPSYSEREILAMLEPFQTGDNTAIAVALGSYADKYTFSAPFEEGLKDVLNVDMVTIETGFLKNIIEDQLNAGQGVYTNGSSQYNVARYMDDTYLNVGKYLGRDLFVAGGISVDYDERRTVMNGMGFDFNVTLEMETPFFNIGWTYLPDDLNSRDSSDGFISDSSITINFRL